MKLSLVVLALLCFATWMSSVHATNGMVASCCLGWSNTKVHHNRITNYAIQFEGVCPITAIVFHTKSGKRICSDPKSDWAKRVMEKVNAKTALLRLGQDGEGGAGEDNRGPAASPGPKTAPRKGCQNGRRRQGMGKNRRGKKGQRKNVSRVTRQFK